MCNAPHESTRPFGYVLLGMSRAPAAANATPTKEDLRRIEEAITRGSVAGDRCYEGQMRNIIYRKNRTACGYDTYSAKKLRSFKKS